MELPDGCCTEVSKSQNEWNKSTVRIVLQRALEQQAAT